MQRRSDQTPLAATLIVALRPFIHVLNSSVAAEKMLEKNAKFGDYLFGIECTVTTMVQEEFRTFLPSVATMQSCSSVTAKLLRVNSVSREVPVKIPLCKRQPKQLCFCILLLHISINSKIRLQETNSKRVDVVVIACWCQSKYYTVTVVCPKTVTLLVSQYIREFNHH